MPLASAISYSQGETEKALPLVAQVVKIFEQQLGKQHPDYVASLHNLAYLYDAQGNYKKALPLYQEVLAICVKVLGEKHPTTQFVKRSYKRGLNQILQN